MPQPNDAAIDVEFPTNSPGTEDTHHADVSINERLYASASIISQQLNFSGLLYSSEEMLSILDRTPDVGEVVMISFDPNNLSEINVYLCKDWICVYAVDEKLVESTIFAVQLCLFDPPWVKRCGPADARRRLRPGRKPKPVDHPWVVTIACP